MRTVQVKGQARHEYSEAAPMTKLVRLDKPIPASVDVTVTYELPDIEPKAGQLWEYTVSSEKFRLIAGKTGRLFMACEDRPVFLYINGTSCGVWTHNKQDIAWINTRCKLIEDAK